MPDLLLTEEERLLQSSVRDFAQRELAPRAQEIDQREEFSWENWRAMAALGLQGIGIDPAYGGSGGGYREVAIVVEEVARGCVGTSVGLITHVSLSSQTILQFGSQEQKRRFLPPMARGERIGAWALTEPGAGSDAASIQTTVVKRNGQYYLNGTKIFSTNGDIADYLVVFATHDRSLRTKGMSAFIVEKGMPGFKATKQHGKMGIRGSTTAELVFEDCPVPEANRLGEEGQGWKIAMNILDSSRIIIAAQSVGIGQAALEAAARYAQQRSTFGKKLGEHQAIQFMLADMATDVHAARLMTLHAATLKDRGLPFINEASMAKLFASEMCQRAADKALQIYGGYGYFKEAPVERLFRDARITTIYEGTSEVQRLIIARQVLQAMAQ